MSWLPISSSQPNAIRELSGDQAGRPLNPT
jgi:hypothetical protein